MLSALSALSPQIQKVIFSECEGEKLVLAGMEYALICLDNNRVLFWPTLAVLVGFP